jgi:acetyl-CoA carboxylase biotin carboxyl carrier protein
MLAMSKMGITELEIEKEGFRIRLIRRERPLSSSLDSFAETLEENPLRVDFEKHRSATGVVAQQELAQGVSGKENRAKDDDSSVFVTSPMVGTIYHAPSPNDPQFVKVGDRVEKNTVICIIEAMKVMNEVKAQVSGTVAEILVENGSPVEFGTKIVRIIPTS